MDESNVAAFGSQVLQKMSGKAKLAGALGVAELLEADLRKPLPISPKKEHQNVEGGYPKASATSPASAALPASTGRATFTSQVDRKTKELVDAVDVMEQKASPKGAAKALVEPSLGAAPTDGYAKPDLPVATRGKGDGKSKGKNLDLSRPIAPGYQSPPKTDISPNAQCTISEGYGPSEIRTKVFRIGAPLLRSTIPVTLGGKKDAKPTSQVEGFEGDDKDGSDVETILSLSDGEHAEEGQLSVTLDFPC
eukprot:s938_g21.t1